MSDAIHFRSLRLGCLSEDQLIYVRIKSFPSFCVSLWNVACYRDGTAALELRPKKELPRNSSKFLPTAALKIFTSDWVQRCYVYCDFKRYLLWMTIRWGNQTVNKRLFKPSRSSSNSSSSSSWNKTCFSEPEGNEITFQLKAVIFLLTYCDMCCNLGAKLITMTSAIFFMIQQSCLSLFFVTAVQHFAFRKLKYKSCEIYTISRHVWRM